MACAGGAAATVVTFEDLEAGTIGGHVMTGGLVVFGQYPVGFTVIPASDPAATGTSGQEALTLPHSYVPGTVVYRFAITGDAFYTSLDLNGAAGQTLTISFNSDVFLPFVLDGDLGAFQTYGIPQGPAKFTSVAITSDSPFTIDNIVYDRPVGWGAVPEPGAWGLMITGFGLAGTALRRRRCVTA